MSKYDYDVSKVISKEDPPFAAILMAAMRKADTENASKLRVNFPEIYEEFAKRYNSPGGYLPGDPRPQTNNEDK